MLAVVDILDDVETSMELRSAIHLEQEFTCRIKVLATINNADGSYILSQIKSYCYNMPIDINPVRHYPFIEDSTDFDDSND